jgi:hypothetical protein
VLGTPNVRRFFVGYLTSTIGTAMSATALAFAVLDSGYGASGLGVVFAAGIVPEIAFMLAGGLFADRLGRRRWDIQSLSECSPSAHRRQRWSSPPSSAASGLRSSTFSGQRPSSTKSRRGASPSASVRTRGRLQRRADRVRRSGPHRGRHIPRRGPGFRRSMVNPRHTRGVIGT